MPTREIIGINKITDEQLQPHLRKRGGGGGKTIINEANIIGDRIEWEGIAGESIEINKFVGLDSEGNYILANAKNGTEAIGIVKIGGLEGDLITIIDLAIVEIAGTFEDGDKIWLGENGMAILPPLEDLMILQEVGIILNDNKALIKINQAKYIE